MDQELIAYIDRRFEDLRGEVNRRFEQVEETVRLTQGTIEGLVRDIRLITKGMMGFSDQMEQRSAEVDRRLGDLKTSGNPFYKNLLEELTELRVTELSRRVAILEGRAERENRHILEVIREQGGLATKRSARADSAPG